MSYRRFATASSLAVLFALAPGCTGSPEPDNHADPVTDPVTDLSSRVSDDELAVAVAAAREEIERVDAEVAVATVVAEPGGVPEPNTGERCTSGRLLRVTLIGDFPGIVTTGYAGAPKGTDLTVHAMGLTADATTGKVCQIGVTTGAIESDPEATVLDLG